MQLAQRRSLVLAVACVVGLSCGTNYIYSAYAPQLSSRLSLTQTQTAIIGAAGNLGVYLSSPFIGRIVDRHGPTQMLIFASVAIATGYLTLRTMYIGQFDGIFATTGVTGLVVTELLTGIGSTAGLSGASNSVAKSYKKQRATALSLVLSAFGLSAFFYSTVWRLFLHSDGDTTPSFLLLLGLGASASMLLGAIFIQPVLPEPLIASDEAADQIDCHYEDLAEADEDDQSVGTAPGPTERTPLRRSTTDVSTVSISVSGWSLTHELDFWLLFLFNGTCAGIGLMYINNLGTVIHSLAQNVPTRTPVAAQQANLVSILSVANCAGRIVTGTLSDYGVHRAPSQYRFSRVWWNVSTASLYAVSQILASLATNVQGWRGLVAPTVITGFAHGSLFGVSGILILERFGMKKFSSNNGVLALAPAIFGQTTNYVFGRIYDHHAGPHLPQHVPINRTCHAGRACYVSAFHLTTGMALLAICLAFVLSSRASMKKRAA